MGENFQIKLRKNANEMQEYLKDLYEWEDNIENSEKNRKFLKTQKSNNNVDSEFLAKNDFNNDNFNDNVFSHILSIKTQGDDYYRRKEYSKAIESYNQLILSIEEVIYDKLIYEIESKEYLLYEKSLSNKLQCLIKLDNIDQIIEEGDKFLSIFPNNKKMLFQLGKVNL